MVMMGKDRRAWRKLVKKLQRSRRRKLKAGVEPVQLRPQSHPIDFDDPESSEDDTNTEKLHEADEAAYWEREKQAQLQFQNKQEALERERVEREAMQARQRAENGKTIEIQRILAEEANARKELAKIQQEEKLNELLEFLSGDLENPPQKYLMPDLLDCDGREPCLYYSKTGACRFFDRCKQAHLQPILSCTILIQNFFTYFYIQQGMNTNSFITDLTLEYEESDAYQEFLQFYNDVMPEFQSVGKIVQFKVCNNFERHMRGNVYVQYDTIKESVEAYRVFNARFYGGKQLTVQFVRIPSWRGAICGKYCRNRCDKGKTCNYIHPFRNPTREFIDADNDWPEEPAARRCSCEKKRRNSDRSRAYGSPRSSSESDLEGTPEVRSPASSTTSDPDKSTPESSPIILKQPKVKERREKSAGSDRKSNCGKDASSQRQSSSSRSTSDGTTSRKQPSGHLHRRRSSPDEDSDQGSPKRPRRGNMTDGKHTHIDRHKRGRASSYDADRNDRRSEARFHYERDYNTHRSRSSGNPSNRHEKTSSRHTSRERDKTKGGESRKHRHKHGR